MPAVPLDLRFPLAGVDLSLAFSNQFVRQLPSGPAPSSRDAINVRGYDTETTRFRGASRPGLSQWKTAQVAGRTWIVQSMEMFTGVGFNTPSGGTVQQSLSGRVVLLVAVADGNVYTASPDDVIYTAAINATANTPPLNVTGLCYSAANNQKLFIVDGENMVFYDPPTDTVFPWVASAGSLPIDSDGNRPRGITTWRGRTVLWGLPKDPQNWFMSRVATPTDFDYSPASTSATQAVAGNNAPAGFIGDVINTAIPYSDDVLIWGGDSSIYLMAGDPMAGGQIDRVTGAIGMAWGRPWCVDPYGTIYFFSTRPGVYSMIPGQEPQRISQGIEQLILDIDTGSNVILLLWNDRLQGLHVFVTPLTVPGETTHFFWEQRTQAWQPDRFASPNFDPLCACIFDGNNPGDRVPLIGCWDGYIRRIDHEATQDDYLEIPSFVLIGPIDTPNQDVVHLYDLQAILGETSGDVTYEIFVGETAESALDRPAIRSGVWKAGHNPLTYIDVAGRAIYIKLSSTDKWAMENIRAKVASTGEVRMRGVER